MSPAYAASRSAKTLLIFAENELFEVRQHGVGLAVEIAKTATRISPECAATTFLTHGSGITGYDGAPKNAEQPKQQPYQWNRVGARRSRSTADDAQPVDIYGNQLPLSSFALVLSGLAALGFNNVNADDLAQLLPPDRVDPALKIMSDVRAYFQVAYKRIADNVPAAIDHELVRGLGRELLPTLYRGLGINGSDGLRICRELAQESPSVTGKREELLKRLERLETASRELVTVGL
ncbi:hypothetical protein B0H19DRAFT_1068245 [Mycena capillaripes]|nr:hypothetical protein B0H19DRAFT_1068245 [Mycena capillaripes]